ncbi:hypothetical protein JMJ77_0003985, partial [Colletotrichum scovillei]
MTMTTKRSLLCDQRLLHPLYLDQHIPNWTKEVNPNHGGGIKEAAYLASFLSL